VNRGSTSLTWSLFHKTFPVGPDLVRDCPEIGPEED